MFETTDESLREYVHTALCEIESLLPDQHELSEIPLERRGRWCGTQFILHGPRSVRLGAVWDADRELLYLYDTAGRRIERRSPRQLRAA